MKKMFLLSTMAILITGSVFWGCKNDEVLTIVENEQAMLKNGVVGTKKVCSPSYYPLVTKNNREVGQITVSNDGNFLTVEFTSKGSSFSEVQLWVGTDPLMVPKNRQDIPVPGKFAYKETDNAVFSIRLSDIFSFTPPPGGSYDGEDVFIFAHAEIMVPGPKGDEEISAWSEGTSFGTSRWGTYSTYITCCQPKGCFPHTASGGNNLYEGVYYYDNTEGGGGSQKIHAENGIVAGTVQYASGTITFSFGQEWIFSETQPILVIEGCEKPGDTLTPLSAEGLSVNSGVYSVSIVEYPYYKIQYNLQVCY
jgi:hypothetical protein